MCYLGILTPNEWNFRYTHTSLPHSQCQHYTHSESQATHYNVITEIYKALITIACMTISFFALKVQHNLAQGKRTVCATPWVNTAFPLYALCRGNTLKSNALHDVSHISQ